MPYFKPFECLESIMEETSLTIVVDFLCISNNHVRYKSTLFVAFVIRLNVFQPSTIHIAYLM